MPPARVPVGPRTLLGRDAELAVLDRALTSLADGGGATLLVTGPAGIGKSALVATALQRAPADLTVRWGIADQDAATPLAALRDCLGVPLPLIGIEVGAMSAVDPLALATEQLLAHVDDLLATGPVVLVLDDLQWADPASLRTWRELAVTATTAPLQLLGLVRTPLPPSASPALRELVTDSPRTVPVPPLAPDAAASLARDLAGLSSGEDPPTWLPDVLAVAAGNPLYVNELTAGLRRERSRSEATADRSRPLRLPATLAEAVAARVGVLTPAVTTTVRAAALLGVSTTLDELAAVLGHTVEEVVPAVAAAVEAGVLLQDGQSLRFRHDLLRTSVREAVPAAMRAAMHEHIAQTLAARGEPVDRVAEHLALGPLPLQRRSVEWLLPVAPTLLQRAPLLAARLVAAALDTLRPDDPRRGVVVLLLAGARLRAGEPGEAADQLVGLLRGTPARWLRTEARWALAFARLATGDPVGAATVLAEELAEEPADPAAGGQQGERRWSFVALSAWAHLAQGRPAAAADEASAVLDALPLDHPTAALAAATSAVVALVERRTADGLPVLDRALAATTGRVGDQPEPSWDDPRHHLLHAAGWSLVALDRCEEAGRRFTEGLRLAERAGGAMLPSLHAGLALQRFLTGSWDEALAQVADGLRVHSVNDTHRMLRAIAALVAASRELSPPPEPEPGEPLPSAEGALAAWAWEQWVALAVATLAERRDEPVVALRRLGDFVERDDLARSGAYFVRPVVVRLALTAGDRDRARDELLVAAREAAEQPTPGRQAALEWCRGMVADEPAPVLRAARRYRDVGYEPFADRALEDAAVMLAAAGRPSLARPAARRSADGYAAREAAWDLARLQHRLRAHGVRVTPTTERSRARTGWDSLSPTELAVARLVAEGLSNPRIADRMLVARRTVATHVSSVLGKLGLGSRTELAALMAHAPAPHGGQRRPPAPAALSARDGVLGGGAVTSAPPAEPAGGRAPGPAEPVGG